MYGSFLWRDWKQTENYSTCSICYLFRFTFQDLHFHILLHHSCCISVFGSFVSWGQWHVRMCIAMTRWHVRHWRHWRHCRVHRVLRIPCIPRNEDVMASWPISSAWWAGMNAYCIWRSVRYSQISFEFLFQACLCQIHTGAGTGSTLNAFNIVQHKNQPSQSLSAETWTSGKSYPTKHYLETFRIYHRLPARQSSGWVSHPWNSGAAAFSWGLCERVTHKSHGNRGGGVWQRLLDPGLLRVAPAPTATAPATLG